MHFQDPLSHLGFDLVPSAVGVGKGPQDTKQKFDFFLDTLRWMDVLQNQLLVFITENAFLTEIILQNELLLGNPKHRGGALLVLFLQSHIFGS